MADKEYWRIPKENMGLTEVLEKWGYGIRKGRENIIRITFADYAKSAYDAYDIGQLGPAAGGLVVFYRSKDIQRVKRAIELREVLELNGLAYSEKPPRKEVIEELRAAAQERADLADKVGRGK